MRVEYCILKFGLTSSLSKMDTWICGEYKKYDAERRGNRLNIRSKEIQFPQLTAASIFRGFQPEHPIA